MFISQYQIQSSVESLKGVHPFFGISFLVLKESGLPVGKTTNLPINHKEDEFLKKYYRPQLSSSWFYRAFRVYLKHLFWLRPDYASNGSLFVQEHFNPLSYTPKARINGDGKITTFQHLKLT